MTACARCLACADSAAASRYSPRSERAAFAATILLALFAQAATAQTCEASKYGLRPGADDNLSAIDRTLKACAGQTIHIAAGVYELSPKGFAVGLLVPAGTTIVGDGHEGPAQTVLRVRGSGNFQSVLWIRNASNVSIHGLRFEGSSYESGCKRHLDYGHAIYVASDAGQSENVENIDISDNEFQDFNGQSWITLQALDGSPGIGQEGRVNISNNVFESDSALQGSCAGSDITHSTAMVALHGSDKSPRGLVSGVSVSSNTFDGAYVNVAVAIWSGTSHVSVQNNVMRDVGMRLASAPRTELGRYAVLIYNSAHELPGLHPDGISVVGNQITNAVSCGIYVASAQDLEISGNRISGQTDRFDQTLPKGAIALNHAARVLSLKDNELDNNYIGIAAVASEVNQGENRIVPAPGGRASRIVPGNPGLQSRPQ